MGVTPVPPAADDRLPAFSTLVEAAAAIDAAFGPRGDAAWRFDRPLQRMAAPAGAPHVLAFGAATTTTMHFGTLTIDLVTGALCFIDEDHRDGGDTVLKRAALPAAWLARLRELNRSDAAGAPA